MSLHDALFRDTAHTKCGHTDFSSLFTLNLNVATLPFSESTSAKVESKTSTPRDMARRISPIHKKTHTQNVAHWDFKFWDFKLHRAPATTSYSEKHWNIFRRSWLTQWFVVCLSLARSKHTVLGHASIIGAECACYCFFRGTRFFFFFLMTRLLTFIFLCSQKPSGAMKMIDREITRKPKDMGDSRWLTKRGDRLNFWGVSDGGASHDQL